MLIVLRIGGNVRKKQKKIKGSLLNTWQRSMDKNANKNYYLFCDTLINTFEALFERTFFSSH